MNPTYGDSFRKVIPDMFSQVVDGVDNVRYKMRTGSIAISLISEPSFDYRMQSSGSLDIAYVAAKVGQFFRQVDVGSFYKISDPQTAEILKVAFEQYTLGEAQKTHNFPEDKQVEIKFQKQLYYNKHSAAIVVRGFASSEEYKIRQAISTLVETPGIFDFYNAKDY